MLQHLKALVHKWFRKPTGRNPSAAGNPPLAVFTMAYNEHDMLPLWAQHYIRQVGAGHVYILDHGSDHLPPLPGCSVITLKRDELDEIERTKIVENFQQKLLQNYRFVLFTDCDEFLIARPQQYLSLRDYAQNCPYKTVQCVGVDVIQQEADMPPVRWHQPVLHQRPYGAIRPWSCKPLLSSVPLSWQPGFHTCDQPATLDTSLWMIHLKYADQKRILQRLSLTRSLQWSQQAIRLRHGDSHRISDEKLIDFFNIFQKNKYEKNLDKLDLRNIIQSGQESSLYRIPHEFINSL